MEKEQQKKLLTEIMEADQKNGLYDIPGVNKKITMAQQTAVEWLVHQEISVDLGSGIKMKIPIPENVIEQAKQMEKEQLINAWRNGDNDSMYPPQELDRQAEEYYNETYGKE